ncbi:hypothetical protein VP01_7220g1, partial [Puccinia sorghi]
TINQKGSSGNQIFQSYLLSNDLDAYDEELFIIKKNYWGHKDTGDPAAHFKSPNIYPPAYGTPWYPDTKSEMDNWIQVNQELKDLGYISDEKHGVKLKIVSEEIWLSLERDE